MFAFLLLLAGGVAFSSVVYSRHLLIQGRLRFVEVADDMINNILEVRRYEKNYFLYGGQNNFELMLQYLTRARQKLDSLLAKGGRPGHLNRLQESRKMILDYRGVAVGYQQALVNTTRSVSPARLESLKDDVRRLGRDMTAKMISLVKSHRREVDKLVHNQLWSLFYSLGAFFLLSAAVAFYLFFLIFRPMATIQAAAREIIDGNVRAIPPVRGAPEVQSLVSALNTMIRELDHKSEQLIQREKMVALGTLTSGVAHELNNPLSNISSSVQIIMEELDEADVEFQRELLSGVESQVEKARDIVKSLLEFAREREFELAPVELGALVEKTIKLIKSEVPPEVDIQLNIPGPIEIQGDQRRLSQALMNLILNSVQAMEGVGGTLTVTAAQDPRARQATLEVTDTGEGIAPQHLDKIFDPFFSTKEDGQGTGLGLYVTYGIINKHGGEIRVSSRPGRGTTFTLTLPAERTTTDGRR
jgi:signal transduction histidine kinase